LARQVTHNQMANRGFASDEYSIIRVQRHEDKHNGTIFYNVYVQYVDVPVVKQVHNAGFLQSQLRKMI
jgi:hypothetical protein